ncbi:MAG: PHP domain-containing protein [Chloroflexota bacterium]|nr:PHP domain-containing protein [Chloroflexota bacterium]
MNPSLKMKLDLHVHAFEAMGFIAPSVESVGKLVKQIKQRGLDGIAVTEHHDKRYGMQAKEIAEQYFDSVLIIPGREVDEGINQVVELFLPNGSMFRFVAHPRYLGSLKIDGRVQGIEVKNALHAGEINEEKVREIARQHNLMLMQNSDAHYLSDIGQFYNEVALEDLYARALPPAQDKGI